MIILTDHKCGFCLCQNLQKILSTKLCSFFLFWNNWNEKEKYILVIRDPKDIIVSGYLYHLKCKEKWCITKNGYYYDSWIVNHFTQDSKNKNKKWTDFAKTFSSNISYQKKLQSMTQTQGIIHEMNNVARLTINGQTEIYNTFKDKSNVLILNFADFTWNLKKICKQLARFCSRNENELYKQLIPNNLIYMKQLHNKHPINYRGEVHTTNITIDKDRTKKIWNDELEKEFTKLFGNSNSSYKSFFDN